jgi:uncharacterized protein
MRLPDRPRPGPAPCAAIAMPAAAASFDCAKARTADEKAICAEPP